MAPFTRSETEIIRAHRKDTTCYVLAESGACLGFQLEEVRRVTGRHLVPITPANLPRISLPTSWMVAVIVCPGDTMDDLAGWTRGLPPHHLERIRFYEAPRGLDILRAYAAWAAARLPDPRRYPFANLGELNQLLGGDLNLRILMDHR